ncbi:MAG TPA: bifunctional adenosylcobinamide kinase/adenosylcobinamide-phosphate guanylyltransferase [Spirochaetia bacterium]|nr:bifunctional adenosylcobinamide kinase/adenosylcobinamide-phosphate guanylyltransferase [Spirochaetaceae bacterium]HPE89557.1 bifunctional adenosylcobinamide kinase/adenosylcobinamide-phosphate guanylyltransferase [Spirochaetales bacterium]HRW23722.1 bifunctional adenosylcobinamide kinase/adenosylcobinamide-phosphate guanylyltransferase [Spirochaetia bacterium]
MRVLLTGGVKSGKSSRALELAEAFAPDRWFLATATPFDDEMRERIRRHKAERAADFVTVEEPIDIDAAARERMVLDCVPMWLNNLFFAGREDDWEPILDRFIARLPRDIVIVTNEIGMGVIPADPMSRRYGMALGRANAKLAAAADSVELLVAGIPIKVK